ncbi:DMT family transporter [Sulfitobacter sp.]|uniref:DMT family transporter n=1 Tax=Sulfitobacter sp. TaxID=1903071 RepID=UPI003001EF52
MSALSLGLIAAFAWGFHDICVRFVSQKAPLMASLLTVLCTGLLFHVAYMLATSGFHETPAKAFAPAVLAGVFFLVASLGLYGAFQRGPVRLVAPIIASFPILSVLWAAFTGTHVTVVEWLTVFVILCGVSTVAYLSDQSAEDTVPKGVTIFFASIASFGYAGTFALGQMAAEMSHHLPATLITRSTAIALLIGGMVVWKPPFWPGRRSLGLLTLMGLADGIALLCMISAGGLANAEYAAVAASVFGLITIVLAWGLLNEKMTFPQWVGCAITFAGIGYLAL